MTDAEHTCLKKKCDRKMEIHAASAAEFASFVDTHGLQNRVQELPQSSPPEQMVRYIAKDDNGVFAICLMPVTYNQGTATHVHPNRKPVNQIRFLGCHPDSVLPEAIAAIPYLRSNDDLIVIDTYRDTLAEALQRKGFVRVNKITDHTGKYAFLPYSETKIVKQTTEHNDTVSFDEGDRFYYHELAHQFSFDIMALMKSGWTIYKRDNRSFLFTLTHGKNIHLEQRACRIDVYDCENGLFTGYCDIHVPDGSNNVFIDVPASGFESVIPKEALAQLPNIGNAAARKADWTRTMWRNRDALWVHLQNRRLGIGRSLTRIAYDISRYLFSEKQRMQVCVNYVNPAVYMFHKKNGAQKIGDGLYQLAYDLIAGERPLIAIVRHTL